MTARAICSRCGRRVCLTRRGVFRQHRHDPRTRRGCPGSGMLAQGLGDIETREDLAARGRAAAWRLALLLGPSGTRWELADGTTVDAHGDLATLLACAEDLDGPRERAARGPGDIDF